ncbi:MAG: peptide chain release factor 1 [Thermodesulfobacteriota bacterium]|nr:peptide chain release factor 1 [Thermodesulfobacteriota bacterium]
MLDKLKGAEERFAKLERLLSDPGVIKDQQSYQRYAREHGELSKLVSVFREYKQVARNIEESTDLLRDGDEEIKELAREDVRASTERLEALELELKLLLIPKDPNDERNVVLEIRAGTGGEEAGLFAADLFKMYMKYAERVGWKVEVLSKHATGVGGLKEIVALVKGKGVYSSLKFESGTHRVQRVPVTESQGRIHTSAVTVAVLPEAEDVDVKIEPDEIRVDVFRSTGPGGQSVNTTDSAVRITHLPTGLVVSCQDEKSQHKNRAKAMKVLRARVYEKIVSEQNEKISQDRRSQVGTGDRSGRIRTYNYPQGRATDHRIGLTLYKLESILEGDLQEIIDALVTHHQALAFENTESQSRDAA